MDNNSKNGRNQKEPKKGNITVVIITLMFTMLCVMVMNTWLNNANKENIPYSEFNQMLKNHEVESVTLSGGRILITPNKNSSKYQSSKADGEISLARNTIPCRSTIPAFWRSWMRRE